jgi:Arc/MetJ-type ribon-helix-helix transcriptional regulator
MSLPVEFENYVQEKVASGQFATPDAFVAEAVRLYRELEERHAKLRGDVEHAMEQFERGESEMLDVSAVKEKARRLREQTSGH